MSSVGWHAYFVNLIDFTSTLLSLYLLKILVHISHQIPEATVSLLNKYTLLVMKLVKNYFMPFFKIRKSSRLVLLDCTIGPYLLNFRLAVKITKIVTCCIRFVGDVTASSSSCLVNSFKYRDRGEAFKDIQSYHLPNRIIRQDE